MKTIVVLVLVPAPHVMITITTGGGPRRPETAMIAADSHRTTGRRLVRAGTMTTIAVARRAAVRHAMMTTTGGDGTATPVATPRRLDADGKTGAMRITTSVAPDPHVATMTTVDPRPTEIATIAGVSPRTTAPRLVQVAMTMRIGVARRVALPAMTTTMGVAGMATPVVTPRPRDAGGNLGATTMMTTVGRVRVLAMMMTTGGLHPAATAMIGVVSPPMTTDAVLAHLHVLARPVTMTTVAAPPPVRAQGVQTPTGPVAAATNLKGSGATAPLPTSADMHRTSML